MTNNILVLGAGLVSRPMVRYLLEQKDFFVTMASRTVSKAEKIINGHPNGKAISLNISNEKMLEELVCAAVNKALENSREMLGQEMSKITGGISLPGFFSNILGG